VRLISSSKRGFSLAEVLVATTLLTVGVFATAATASLLARLIAQGTGTTRAAAAAASQLDQIRTGACAASPGADTAPGGYVRSWSVAGSATARVVTVEVTTDDGRARHTHIFVAAMPCAGPS